MTVLKSYKSALMGVKAEVIRRPSNLGGWRVVVTDEDAGEVVGVRAFTSSMGDACAYAQRCVDSGTEVAA